MTVERREPGPIRRNSTGRWDELIDAALTNPGEWFAVELGRTKGGSVYTNLYRALGARYGEVRIDDGSIFLRVHP